jgi:hypothetical protein
MRTFSASSQRILRWCAPYAPSVGSAHTAPPSQLLSLYPPPHLFKNPDGQKPDLTVLEVHAFLQMVLRGSRARNALALR